MEFQTAFRSEKKKYPAAYRSCSEKPLHPAKYLVRVCWTQYFINRLSRITCQSYYVSFLEFNTLQNLDTWTQWVSRKV